MLSGVNRGPNLAGDVLYSGTCAAARESFARGIPSAALSLASILHQLDDWGGVDHYLASLLAQFTATRSSALLNINFPSASGDAIRGTQATRLGSYPADRFIAHPGVDPRGHAYWWPDPRYPIDAGAPGTDIAAVADRFISRHPCGRT